MPAASSIQCIPAAGDGPIEEVDEMSGLIGVLLYPAPRSAEMRREIISIVTSGLVTNERQGQEATGIAVIETNGRCWVLKQPVRASELVQVEGYKQALSTLGGNSVCILGHTRAAAKGSRWRNVNNHPLVAGHVVGIHNGVITNDDELFAHLDLPRVGEVDSEIIFRLLDTVNPLENGGSYPALARKRIGLVEGTFTTLSVDLRRPTGLLVLKKLDPLWLHYERKFEALFFSSYRLSLHNALGHAVSAAARNHVCGLYFDAQHLPLHGHRPLASFDIP